MLFPTKGQVIYVLLTRPPLALRRVPVRLACIRHAASVCPEPGSNSPNKYFLQKSVTQTSIKRFGKGSNEPHLLLLLVQKKLTVIFMLCGFLTTLQLLR
jgi:hypothetical protein